MQKRKIATQFRDRAERRQNRQLSNAVDIAMVYSRLFGKGVAYDYLLLAGVSTPVINRIISGRTREKLFET